MCSIQSWQELESFSQDLQELADESIEPNVFFEPWFLIPALRVLKGDAVELVLVWSDRQDDNNRILIGLFPCHKKKGYRHLPIKHLGIWSHKYCFLGVPLIRKGFAGTCMDEFLEWLIRSRYQIFKFDHIDADGEFNKCLQRLLGNRSLLFDTTEAYSRALLQVDDDFESHFEVAYSKGRRRELRRQQRRLSEVGERTIKYFSDPHERRRWSEEFLSLEASGWKGAADSAMANNKDDARFFDAITANAAGCGRLAMARLSLDDVPVAMNCHFHAAGGAFAFKTAYDQDYARYSPGMQLELAKTRNLVKEGKLNWVDSCTRFDNDLMNRLWRRRRRIQSITVGISLGGAGAITAGKMMAKLSRVFKKT